MLPMKPPQQYSANKINKSSQPESDENPLMQWIVSDTGANVIAFALKNVPTMVLLGNLLFIFNAPSKSWKTVENNLLRESGLKQNSKTFKVCRGNFRFSRTVDDEAPQNYCPVCWCIPDQDDEKDYVTYIPLIKRSKSIAANE